MLSLAGRAASYGEVWYDEQPPAAHGADILVFRQRRAPMPGARNVPMLSIASDLTLGCDGIVAAYERECRYEVRRADTKDGLTRDYHAEPQAVMAEFRASFTAFAQRASVDGPDAIWLDAAQRAGRLLLASASRDGERLVWHAYLLCGETIRLMHSVSLFRDRDPGYRALVGRANRWLHWRDMLAFKALGLRRYDWGGLFADEIVPGHAGINRFKRSFGGHQVRNYDCTIGVTLRGRLYLPLRDAWRRHVVAGEARAKARDEAWQLS